MHWQHEQKRQRVKTALHSKDSFSTTKLPSFDGWLEKVYVVVLGYAHVYYVQLRLTFLVSQTSHRSEHA